MSEIVFSLEEGKRPSVIRFRFVREELIAV